MSTNKCIRLLAELEAWKRGFGTSPANLFQLLRQLEDCRLKDGESLVHFHEALLFFRAYPPNAAVLKAVEKILSSYHQRVSELWEAGVDLSALDDPEASGIAGTSVTSNFSYELVRWLAAKYPAQTSIDWDWFEEEERFGATMSRFLPLLAEDAMVEAHVPYRSWERAAVGRGQDVPWIVRRFASLPVSPRARAELYDSLKLHVTWEFEFRASRSGMKLPVRRPFFHEEPLIPRRDVSLAGELASRRIPVKRLSRKDGERILDLARETSAVRYRELHGFTYGDPGRVLKAELGRGVEVFLSGVPPENRLPLRAYHAALIFKNGVPVGYFEGLSIFERMESGFNLYYTFRDGETAWLYARVLRLMRQVLGVTVFSIDPYQVGHENEEGIESGAFWFYRKLGFYPVRPELIKLMISEEKRIAAKPGYRTSARTLRRLASGHMLFDSEPSRAPGWDRFEVRNVGLAVQRRMGRDFSGEAERIRAHSVDHVKRTLELATGKWNETELSALSDLSLVLGLIPDLKQWSAEEKQLAGRIIRAKAGRDESQYLRLMQLHMPLRSSFIRLGSAQTR